MRSVSRLVLSSLLVLGLVPLSASAKPNFTGEWKLNVAKSDFGEFPPPSSLTQKTTHEDPALKLASKMVTDNGEMEFESVYSTDGTETTNNFGPSTMKSIAKWEGDALTIQTKGQFGDNEVTIQDKWEASEDGKTLTIRRNFTSSMGVLNQKLVLEKQ